MDRATMSRKARRSARPSFDSMEARQLLSAAPMIYSNSARAVEDGSAPVTMNFTVCLATPSSGPVTVDYHTADATAKAGLDYVAASGSLTFAPGQMSRTVSVTVLPDAAAGTTNRAFFLALDNAGGGKVFTPTLAGTVVEQNPAVLPAAPTDLLISPDGSSLPGAKPKTGGTAS